MEEYLQEYNVFHTHDKDNTSGRKGVSIELKNNIIDIDKVEIRTDEGTNDGERCIRITLNSILNKLLHIWGIYAPTLAKERKQWMKEIGEEIGKNNGYRIIAGDFNFVTDTRLDKRGGRSNSGTTGSIEQKNRRWISTLAIHGENNTQR